MQLAQGIVSRRGLAIKLLAAAAVLRYGVAKIRDLLFHDAYDGLDGIVSFSSRIIAAWRALESDQAGGALFSDPLARVLAGPTAMRRAEQRVEAMGGVLSPELQAASGRRYQINRIAIRTLWFDEALLGALACDSRHPAPLQAQLALAAAGGGDSGANGGGNGGVDGAEIVKLKLVAAQSPQQVVLLGAGMDTRAWRLALPPGVEWFEVDRADVLAAKRAALMAAGATFEPPSDAAAAAESAQYPLRAGSYAALEADLREQGWTAALEAAGFDRSLPTVWLAEGLLMYLEQDANYTMLREIAGASAPGSVLLALSVTEAVITNIRAKRSEGQLLNKFVWGCPPDPREMLRGLGWDVQRTDTRVQMVRDFKLDPAIVCDFNTPSPAYNSLFIVATPCDKAG